MLNVKQLTRKTPNSLGVFDRFNFGSKNTPYLCFRTRNVKEQPGGAKTGAPFSQL